MRRESVSAFLLKRKKVLKAFNVVANKVAAVADKPALSQEPEALLFNQEKMVAGKVSKVVEADALHPNEVVVDSRVAIALVKGAVIALRQERINKLMKK